MLYWIYSSYSSLLVFDIFSLSWFILFDIKYLNKYNTIRADCIGEIGTGNTMSPKHSKKMNKELSNTNLMKFPSDMMLIFWLMLAISCKCKSTITERSTPSIGHLMPSVKWLQSLLFKYQHVSDAHSHFVNFTPLKDKQLTYSGKHFFFTV